MICLLLLLPGQENHQTDGSSEITPFAIRYVGEVTNNYCRAGFKSLLRCCNACRRECKGVSFVKPNCCLYNELSMRSFSINPSEQSSNAIYVGKSSIMYIIYKFLTVNNYIFLHIVSDSNTDHNFSR